MLIKSIPIEVDVLKLMPRHSSIVYGYIMGQYLNTLTKKQMHNITQLPDKRIYETFTDEYERNRRANELKHTK